MARTEGKVLEDERLYESDDDSGDETDSDEVATYNPHIGIGLDLSLGDYVQALMDQLLLDEMWAKTDPHKTQRAIHRLQVQDGPWAPVRWARDHLDAEEIKGTINSLTADVKVGALLFEEWNDLWTGIGGWVRKKEKKTLRQQQRYEMVHQVKTSPGVWTKDHSVHARQYLVGDSGRRGDPIRHALDWRMQSWTFKGAKKRSYTDADA